VQLYTVACVLVQIMPLAVVERTHSRAVSGIVSHGYNLSHIYALPGKSYEKIEKAGKRLRQACLETGRPTYTDVIIRPPYRSSSCFVKLMLSLNI